MAVWRENNLHLCGHKARVFGLSWRPARDEATAALASASEDQSVIVWHLAGLDGPAPTHRKAHVLAEAHTSEVLRCAWSPTGNLLATGGADGAARVFAIPDAAEVAATPAACARLELRERTAGGPEVASSGAGEDDDQIYGLAFAESDARLLVAAGACVRSFDVPSERCSSHFSLTAAPAVPGGFVFGGQRNAAADSFIFDLALSADCALLALACSTGRALVLDARMRSPADATDAAGVTLEVSDSDYVSACTFVPAKIAGSEAPPGLLFTACGSGACALWDVRAPRAPLARCTPHDGTAYCCSALGAGRVATVGRDKKLLIHSLAHLLARGAAGGDGGAVAEHSDTVERALGLPDRGLCCAGQGGLLAAAGGSGNLINDTAVHVWAV